MNRTYFGRYRRYLTEAVFANHNSQGNRISSTLHVRLSVSASVCVLVYVCSGVCFITFNSDVPWNCCF